MGGGTALKKYQKAAGFITLATRSVPFNGLLGGGRSHMLKWPIKVSRLLQIIKLIHPPNAHPTPSLYALSFFYFPSHIPFLTSRFLFFFHVKICCTSAGLSRAVY